MQANMSTTETAKEDVKQLMQMKEAVEQEIKQLHQYLESVISSTMFAVIPFTKQSALILYAYSISVWNQYDRPLS